jgi:hypothetical protein
LKGLSTAGLAIAAIGLTACGGGGSGGTTTGASAPGVRPGGGLFASLTASQRSCVAKQGVTLPNGRRPGSGGPPPGAGNGGPPPNGGGTPPAGARNRDPARFQKMQAAFKKCGVTLPSRPPGGVPPGQAGTTTTN